MSLSQIDSPAAVLSDGTMITIAGPVQRAGDEVDDIEFVLLVVQDGAVARGRTWARDLASTWATQLYVEGGTFRPGPATATALALIEVRTPPGILTQTWTEQIELVEPGAAAGY